ncbi:MAG TPA: hypothetical protein VEP91_00280 [Solirubrobacterales bacterium]|nr:hypothetical protein [Solirubrobacterales bacterium]
MFLCALSCGSSTAAAAAPAPAWTISSLAMPTNFAPGDPSGEDFYEVTAIDSGGGATDGSPVRIVDTLPSGVAVESVSLKLAYGGSMVEFGPSICAVDAAAEGETVTCTVPSQVPPPFAPSADEPALLYPNEGFRLLVHVSTAAVGDGTPLVNRVEVQGGGATPAAVTRTNEASEQPAPSAFAEFSAALSGEDGQTTGEAAYYPYQYRLGFALNVRQTGPGAFAPAGGSTKDIRVALPPGLLANPLTPSRCTAQRFSAPGGTDCPDASAVGLILLRQVDGNGAISPLPLYNLEPPPGMPAQFGFQVANLPFYVNTEVRSGSDYGFDAVLANLSEIKRLTAATLVLWGDPSDPGHDPERGHCLSEGSPDRFSLGPCPVARSTRPFLRLPSSCSLPLDAFASFDLWRQPGVFQTAVSSAPPPTGCAGLEFAPTFGARLLDTVAASPTGMRIDLHLPQGGDLAKPASADLRDLTIAFPAGLTINPSTAAGLIGCSSEQLRGGCPDASKIGRVEARTPLLDRPLQGGLFVASPEDNPFGSLFAVYAVAADAKTGVEVELAGRIEADPVTGRLTARFADLPQLPFEEFAVTLFSGPRAPLRTPLTCGAYRTTADFVPWSAPESGPGAGESDSFEVVRGAGGGPCAPTEFALPNAPTLRGGTLEPIAGASSPLAIELRRDDGTQNLAALDLTLPPGILARVAGIPFCSEAEIELARRRSGAAELRAPSCPADSRVGIVSATVGSGERPLQLEGGRVYLAGPYKGAPLSLAAVVPALAGPFDLGTVVLRTALFVDPARAQLHAVSDSLPPVLRGIPLDLRALRIELDRPGFILNPTSCDEMAIRGTVFSQPGASAPVSERFQVGDCGRLGFKPRVAVQLSGGTGRSGHPRLKAVLRPRAGDANPSRAAVVLPPEELLDQRHIVGVCTEARFAADDCPRSSRYGVVKAWSPLVDHPFVGRLNMRSSSRRLPDLAAHLDGQFPLSVAARVESVHGALRITLADLPDIPLARLELVMWGGGKGLLVNSRDLCERRPRVVIDLDAHNGRKRDIRPRARVDCAAIRRHSRTALLSH